MFGSRERGTTPSLSAPDSPSQSPIAGHSREGVMLRLKAIGMRCAARSVERRLECEVDHRCVAAPTLRPPSLRRLLGRFGYPIDEAASNATEDVKRRAVAKVRKYGQQFHARAAAFVATRRNASAFRRSGVLGHGTQPQFLCAFAHTRATSINSAAILCSFAGINVRQRRDVVRKINAPRLTHRRLPPIRSAQRSPDGHSRAC